MTNFEKIKAMTVEEMAKFIDRIIDDDVEIWHGFCDICDSGKETRWCWECVYTWLESEVAEDDQL